MIGAQSGSVGMDAHGSEPTTGDESEGPITQISLEVKFVFGSIADECAASVAGSNLSSDSTICSESKARAVMGVVSWMQYDDRFRSCPSGWPGVVAAVSNPAKIKYPRMSAT